MTPNEAQDKLWDVKTMLQELEKLGASYAHWQDAKFTHGAIKKALKALDGTG